MPEAVRELAVGERVRLVWSSEDGSTFEIGEGEQRRFVKWRPVLDLTPEALRLSWAAQFVAVPRVLSVGADHAGMWLVSAPLAGECAISPRWKARPAVAVAALGRGLRQLHDALPVADCPFSWSAAHRLGQIDDPSLRARLDPPPPIDRLVVCHGDACSPNTILDDDGRVSGHVDLDALGVADRWADLAVATRAATWNYGPGFEGALLQAYGIENDPVRSAYYRALWDAAP